MSTLKSLPSMTAYLQETLLHPPREKEVETEQALKGGTSRAMWRDSARSASPLRPTSCAALQLSCLTVFLCYGCLKDVTLRQIPDSELCRESTSRNKEMLGTTKVSK